MVEDAAGGCDFAVDFKGPFTVGVIVGAKGSSCGRMGGGEFIFEDDLFAYDAVGMGVQHDGEQGIVALGLDCRGLAAGKQAGEEVEDAGAELRKDVELEGGAGSGPRAADEDGAVAGGASVGLKEKGLGQAGPCVQRVVDDLAVHLPAVEIAPVEDFRDGDRLGTDIHAVLHKN